EADAVREFEEATIRDAMRIFMLAPEDWAFDEVRDCPKEHRPAWLVRHLPTGHEENYAGHPNPNLLIAAAILKIWDEKLKRPRPQILPPERRLPAKVF